MQNLISLRVVVTETESAFPVLVQTFSCLGNGLDSELYSYWCVEDGKFMEETIQEGMQTFHVDSRVSRAHKSLARDTLSYACAQMPTEKNKT